MSRVQTLTEQDKTIVFTDLSNLAVEDSSPVMEEAIQIISKYPLKSVYSLVHMYDMRFNKDVIKKVTETGQKNEPYVIATAIVGLTPVTKLIAKSVIKLTGRNTVFFDTLDEGKAWLLDPSR